MAGSIAAAAAPILQQAAIATVSAIATDVVPVVADLAVRGIGAAGELAGEARSRINSALELQALLPLIDLLDISKNLNR